MGNEYIKRISDEKLEFLLKVKGAVLIEGPKWCGKTWTALTHANTVGYIIEHRGRSLCLEQAPAAVLQAQAIVAPGPVVYEVRHIFALLTPV